MSLSRGCRKDLESAIRQAKGARRSTYRALMSPGMGGSEDGWRAAEAHRLFVQALRLLERIERRAAAEPETKSREEAA